MMRGAGAVGSSGHICALLFTLIIAACSARNGAVRAAEQSDERALRSELLRARAEGRLQRSLAQDVARALLEGELRRSRGREGAAFVASLTPCSRGLRASLKERSQKHDPVGGEALLLLVEGGQERGRARAYEEDEIASYRSAFARTLTRAEDAERRAPLYADPDQRVRRAALDAALGSTSASEFNALSEAARLDPDPLCRSKALRLIGTIEDPKSLSFLLARYASATERERLSVLEGLREQAKVSQAARDELVYIASSAQGLVRLAAARLLLASSPDASLTDEQRESLQNSVSEFARSGAPPEQILALRFLTPNTQKTRDLLKAAAASPNEEVRVSALELLLADAEEKSSAVRELLLIAAKDSPAGRKARDALAERGDTQVLPFVLRDTTAQSPGIRLSSAHSLLALERWDHAGILLADPDQDTQMQLACTMLMRE